jgi:D,D-heptose 1,7-bisphosphate phosphatase
MNRAVFLDRDNTVIEDPGYLSDPGAVKLLPGVELALKSLAQEGYKLVVVTNQSGIARGLFTEEALENVHAEVRRQLADRAVHLDAIYYCPFHPEGTIERYTRESDLRKPRPGMILQGARELGIDLFESWMVGDDARDVEAGQRAGCRTIRIRPRGEHRPTPGEEDSETAQADYTVRNLVEAARTVLRAPARTRPAAPSEAQAQAGPDSAAAVADGSVEDVVPAADVGAEDVAPAEAARGDGDGAFGTPRLGEDAPREAPPEQHAWADGDAEIGRDLLRYVRQIACSERSEDFSFIKLLGTLAQAAAFIGLIVVLAHIVREQDMQAISWGVATVVVQLIALTMFTIRGR